MSHNRRSQQNSGSRPRAATAGRTSAEQWVIAPPPTRADGGVLAGSGIAAPALLAPALGFARLLRVDPVTGATTPYAEGLSMGNGVVRAPDGTVFTSNDLAPALDRVDPDGTVHRGWYRETPTNGLAISADGRTLYANVSLGDTRTLAIDVATGAARTYFRPPQGLAHVFLDDLDIDRAGRLYAPVYFGGQVWRIERDGSFCAVADGLTLPAGITVGVDSAGFSAGSVYVTTHAGQVVEIPNAIPADGR
ncbi:SMP-30/gluconolactonase/LRE family protein [Nocardia farcinica]|nr:SMP-30/gluconolactonase/LRE family protein [Nocardia farcinica]